MRKRSYLFALVLPLIIYVKERVVLNDLVAIYATGAGDLRVLQPFTSDKARLIESLARADLSGTGHRGERDYLKTTIQYNRQLAAAGSNFSQTLGGGADYVPGAPLLASGTSGPFQSALASRSVNVFSAMLSLIPTISGQHWIGSMTTSAVTPS